MLGKRNRTEEYYSARKRLNELGMEAESLKVIISQLSEFDEVRKNVFYDPFIHLPYEVVYIIIFQLNMTLCQLIKLTHVSKAWRNLLLSGEKPMISRLLNIQLFEFTSARSVHDFRKTFKDIRWRGVFKRFICIWTSRHAFTKPHPCTQKSVFTGAEFWQFSHAGNENIHLSGIKHLSIEEGCNKFSGDVYLVESMYYCENRLCYCYYNNHDHRLQMLDFSQFTGLKTLVLTFQNFSKVILPTGLERLLLVGRIDKLENLENVKVVYKKYDDNLEMFFKHLLPEMLLSMYPDYTRECSTMKDLNFIAPEPKCLRIQKKRRKRK